jgi:VIT1/CCC1 family predicted Fe2+/Mn2+ transporter
MLRRGWLHRIATMIAFGGGIALPLLPVSFVPNAVALIVSVLAILFAFAKDAWVD